MTKVHVFPEDAQSGVVPQTFDQDRFTLTGIDEFANHVHACKVVGDDSGAVQLWINVGSHTAKFWLDREQAKELIADIETAIDEAADFGPEREDV